MELYHAVGAMALRDYCPPLSVLIFFSLFMPCPDMFLLGFLVGTISGGAAAIVSFCITMSGYKG